MKRMRRAIRVISMLLTLAFVALGSFLIFTVYSQGARLLTNQYNNRLTAAKKTVQMGDITDRTGVVLATTGADGLRVYSADKATRRALSQTVGDQMSMSGTGVETFHAGTLLGLSGSIIDRAWQYVSGGSYRGDNIRLTVSAELTTYISGIFPSGKEGAAVVVNYKTGEILAMVSKPDYDPAALANRQSGADVTGSGYLNRCLQGQYTPGSVFKICTLASAFSHIAGVEAHTFDCEATRAFGEGTVTCFDRTAHGRMTLLQAFAKSCNVSFAQLTTELGAARLIETCTKFGFNENFAFRDIVLYESSVPASIETTYDLAWTGVGQGKLLVTPMHMAMIAGAIANEGVMREPQLIRQVTGAGGIARLRTASGVYRQAIDAGTAALVKNYMRAVVEKGTGTAAKIKGYTVCGKTGTAEVSNDKSVPTNAWFVGFVDDEQSPYAVAVVVEQGGNGGTTAAPLAAKALKKAISLGL